jgi:hypothetical protein
MFIARHYLNNARSIGAQRRHQLHFAPNGANHFAWWPGYKHVAPPEQRPGQLGMLQPLKRSPLMLHFWGTGLKPGVNETTFGQNLVVRLRIMI